MLFTEPAFLFLFLPVLLLVYFASPWRARNLVLTVASLLFYAVGEWRFLPWLLASIAVNYWVAVGLDRLRGTPLARQLLVLGIVSDLGLLLVFKYTGFVVQNVNVLLTWIHLQPLRLAPILLPLGISFFTFHKISYKLDVYRGHAEVRRNPLDLALYILLFPQLIAGPIIRYHDIAGELVRRTISRADFAQGIRRFITGLGKKMLIANTVALAADRIFAIPAGQLTTSVSWLGIVCYTLQIYFDFSGYSDMAIGLARMFGFHFLENFEHPYIASSITEFWRRWHISLSRWFRDYLYIPLGGNRQGPLHTYLNLMIVFFLCGLWHGASWSFVVWGLYHGMYLVFERLGLGRAIAGYPRALRHAYTLFVVMVGWVFFRADTLPQALAFLRSMLGLGPRVSLEYHLRVYLNSELAIALAVGLVGSVPLRAYAAPAWSRARAALTGLPAAALELSAAAAGNAALGLVLLLSAMKIAAGTYNPFIYFRF